MSEVERPSPPSSCTWCGKRNKVHAGWYWAADVRYRARGKWRCKTQKRAADARRRAQVKLDPERLAAHKASQKRYYVANPEYRRYKAYKSIDKVRGCLETLEKDLALTLMSCDCTYCGQVKCGGLDRRDSSIGHTRHNVVPCCERCNNILGDLPAAVKDLLAPGLYEARISGFLDSWCIPTKRRFQ